MRRPPLRDKTNPIRVTQKPISLTKHVQIDKYNLDDIPYVVILINRCLLSFVIELIIDCMLLIKLMPLEPHL